MYIRSNILNSTGIKELFVLLIMSTTGYFTYAHSLTRLTTSPVYSVCEDTDSLSHEPIIQTGAERIEKYIGLLKNKRVGLVVNQTAIVGRTHLIDTLRALGINIKRIFAPEHGFRGTADAGEHVASEIDKKTGIPVVSLYGKNKKPTAEQLADLDVIIYDIQDVGARFYTYISTMYQLMESCAENKKSLIILDRPNPNGDYVDGPVLDMSLKSFVGMLPLPVIHGLTVGELAQMINGEKWLKDSLYCSVTIIPVAGYTHLSEYILPVKPSPNLPNQQAIRLYPSLCFFEGTNVSVGRGTLYPFQVIGSPYIKDTLFYFIPDSIAGMAKDPMYRKQKCYGYDLRNKPYTRSINLDYIITMYQLTTNKEAYFGTNNFFDKLAGTTQMKKQIISGLSENSIRETWKTDLSSYKIKRKKYLLYPDFE